MQPQCLYVGNTEIFPELNLQVEENNILSQANSQNTEKKLALKIQEDKIDAKEKVIGAIKNSTGILKSTKKVSWKRIEIERGVDAYNSESILRKRKAEEVAFEGDDLELSR
ncbi:hypothetical protein GOBAR_AA22337 [Gossypium barbadense]|uniref:Uncharacterized protein n=1 Tax=Gossypium barbadense TaxID=3634 RepID=A0A2P5X4R3_GOSBA|nr:hypothetical protein GOBAR_AA22337 [Gossypium barbadense]